MLIEHPAISEYFLTSGFLADELFFDLSLKAQKKLQRIKQNKQIAAGETVFASGENSRGIYLLRAGDARLLHYADQAVRAVRENEILGLTEAITDLPYETGVRAFSPCEFEFIRRADFIEFLQTEPEICFRLLQILGTNIQKIYRIFY